MKNKKIAVGILLCVLALALCVALQAVGYLTYLDSDMASELMLAREQADTHSLVQMDWLYSTEVRIVQINLLYALAFLLTPSFFLARIIGNTLGLMLAMGACVYVCRKARLSWAYALCAAALLPVTASPLYAMAVTVGGYYIVHIAIGLLGAGVWLCAAERGRRVPVVAYGLLCLLQGFLSVRYVLCFVCPMVVVAAMEMMLVPSQEHSLRSPHMRFGLLTGAGFIACLAGYAASEIVLPRLFVSGVGAASSFAFNPLDGMAMVESLAVVAADFLKLLGWRGEAALFSPAGVVNLCVAGTLFLGTVMTRRVYARLGDGPQKRLMQYALAAVMVNLFCFVFIRGTYLNRYQVLAVIFLLPVLAIVLNRERSQRLRVLFLLLLCVQLGVSQMLVLSDARASSDGTDDQMAAASFLQENGYTHGYGTFWNVRVMQERTQGALTFTGVVPVETEEGAVSEVSLELIRWLEPDAYSDLNVCPGRTFLLLTRQEEEQLAPWLAMAAAPRIYENGTYSVYGFASSAQLTGAMLFGRMKLENATYDSGVYTIQAGGRMRVPTAWREAGSYTLQFTCEGTPAEDSVVELYTTSGFELLHTQAMEPGENIVSFTLDADDKYFMILFKGGQVQELALSNLVLGKL